MNRGRTLAALAAVALLAAPAAAWNEAGHRLIALLAWEQLGASAREHWAGVLRHHPRFSEDFAARMPREVRDGERAAQDRWIFTQAAVWPDLAREFQGDARSLHHPTWHYLNEPVFLSDADRESYGDDVPAQRDRVWHAGMRLDGMNLLQALERARFRAGQEGRTRGERALEVCWILHLIGDVHQPLHCAALFSRRGFPRGDRGGNQVLLQGPAGNLHAFWDGAGDVRNSWKELLELAAELSRDPDTTARGRATRQGDAAAWLEEGHALAVEEAYAPFLDALRRQERALPPGRTLEEGCVPLPVPADLPAAARRVARERWVTAAIRCAAWLQE